MGDFDTAWHDLPATDTPITSTWLSAVDAAVRTERSDRVPDALLTKLDQASASAVVVVLGDSTGVPASANGFWVDYWAAMLGARWTGHKVTLRLWGSTSYGAASTVANAGAGLTLDIYNGSVGGTKADYPLTRIADMVPVRPDLVILNYGHNHGTDSPATFEASIDTLVAAVRDAWADAPVVVTSQNPRFSPAPNVTEHAAREQAERAWTATREYGYVPTWEAFQSQATPSAFVQSDGVHPTTSGATDGSKLWAQTVDAYITGRGRRPAASPAPTLTVLDEGSTVATSVGQLDLQGAGVTAQLVGGKVVVTIPGGGSGSAMTARAELLMQDGVTGPPVPLENEARDDWLYTD